MTGMMKKYFWLHSIIIFLITLPFSASSFANKSLDVETALKPFVGIPYRVDGASDTNGRYTLIADEFKTFSTPGFNCSGFVLAATRALLGESITIEQAKRDRLGDSGPKAKHGEDWDFGWDFVLNVSEGKNRVLLLPNGKTADPSAYDGFKAPTFGLTDTKTWQELMPRFKKDRIYLLSFSRNTQKKPYSIMHYHVAVVVVNNKGQVLMYQTTNQYGKSYKRNLSDPKEMGDFLRAFADSGTAKKRIAVIEVQPR